MNGTREHMPILLVEDDPLIALDAEDMLLTAGFHCLIAYDTDSAQSLLENGPVRAAILDYDLGDETSLGIAERAFRIRVPYVFVTGRNRSEILGRAPGPVAIHPKPADYAEVARQLALHAGA